MALYFITTSHWNTFAQFLAGNYATYGLVQTDDNLTWERLTPETVSTSVISVYRAVEPVKGFLFPVKEEVTKEPAERKTVLLGVKACDIAHLTTTDAVFTKGVLVDPYYAAKRQQTIIISSDCDDYRPSCFCTLMGGKPYPVKGFDINLTPVSAGFIVETGSETGERLIAEKKGFFEKPRPEQLKEREGLRERMEKAVMENNKEFTWKNPREIVEATLESPLWEEDIAKTCVECDACRFTCGTCYCFLLAETKRDREKLRTWDSCQSEGYGRVAGGGNPRKSKAERLRNLYQCKLSYRPENFGAYACTGCGRCIEVCQGRIDIRKSLQKLSPHKR